MKFNGHAAAAEAAEETAKKGGLPKLPCCQSEDESSLEKQVRRKVAVVGSSKTRRGRSNSTTFMPYFRSSRGSAGLQLTLFVCVCVCVYLVLLFYGEQFLPEGFFYRGIFLCSV